MQDPREGPQYRALQAPIPKAKRMLLVNLVVHAPQLLGRLWNPPSLLGFCTDGCRRPRMNGRYVRSMQPSSSAHGKVADPRASKTSEIIRHVSVERGGVRSLGRIVNMTSSFGLARAHHHQRRRSSQDSRRWQHMSIHARPNYHYTLLLHPPRLCTNLAFS